MFGTKQAITKALSEKEARTPVTIKGEIARIGVAPKVQHGHCAYVFRLRGDATNYEFAFDPIGYANLDVLRHTLALTQPGDQVEFLFSAWRQVLDFKNLSLDAPVDVAPVKPL